jgi:hypothetical protein
VGEKKHFLFEEEKLSEANFSFQKNSKNDHRPNPSSTKAPQRHRKDTAKAPQRHGKDYPK